jgi:hypothetical protein
MGTLYNKIDETERKTRRADNMMQSNDVDQWHEFINLTPEQKAILIAVGEGEAIQIDEERAVDGLCGMTDDDRAILFINDGSNHLALTAFGWQYWDVVVK